MLNINKLDLFFHNFYTESFTTFAQNRDTEKM